MWKASAINANEETQTPTPSSTQKKIESRTTMAVIRASFEIFMVNAVRVGLLVS